MRIRGFWYDIVLIAVTAAVAAAFTVVTVFAVPKLALVEAIGYGAVLIFALVRAFTAKNRYQRFLKQVTQRMDYTDQRVLSTFRFPVAVCDAEGFIDWCSDSFLAEIAGGQILPAAHIDAFTNGIGLQALLGESETTVLVNDRYYSVTTLEYENEGSPYCLLTFVEVTALKRAELEYYRTRPYCVIVELDNLDDGRNDFRDSEKAEIRSRIEAALDDWVDGFDSFAKRITDDRYMIITEQCNFNRMVQTRFSILETVRSFEYKAKRIGVTLSIGAAGGASVRASERAARKALEMALGRGGDQVAIKTQNGYDFIGGVSKSAEKRTKVKSRVIASALTELMRASGNVLIMGHTYTDLDAIGAAVGVLCAAQGLQVPAYIVTDRAKSMAGALLHQLDAEGYGERIVDAQRAAELMDRKTLLVVVDTHVESFVEFPALYQKAATRVIVDHHRLSAEPSETVVLFHHDPSASSASEMVTELLQYIGAELTVDKTVAEALLSGIMLDTKSFVLRVGTRTFEAAAYLKEKGADTVQVKKLFASSMEVQKSRNQVIAAAETYRDCAISAVTQPQPEVRIVAAQAADELLGVREIRASFVLFPLGDGVQISARSLGDMNVQVLMEQLGGGGHRTMAACQLPDCTLEEAKTRLIEAIDRFFDENT